MLAELQGANIRHDGPPIPRFNARGVSVHHAIALGHHVKEMTGGRFAQTRFMERRRPWKTAFNDHAIACAGTAVTDRTVNIEPFAAARKDLRSKPESSDSLLQISVE